MRGIVGTRVNSCIGAILIAAIIASWPLAVERTAAGEEKRETGEDEADARRESVSASYLQTPCFSTSTHRPSQPARGTYQTSDGSQVPAGARSDARGSTKNSDGEDSDSSTLTGPPVKLFIRPPTAVVRADGTYKFGARAMDASGTMFPVDADWSSENGTVDGSGLFNPWSVGQWSVHAWYAGLGASALA
ncbi:MAG TPA: hypothetical protein VI893_10905, partial [Thermoplasmata archaeon]|nr:hypothetical protein [Thermoplasmata archaeon]